MHIGRPTRTMDSKTILAAVVCTVIFFVVWRLFSSGRGGGGGVHENFSLQELRIAPYVLYMPNRLASIQATMEGLGIAPTFVQGIDKNTIDEATLVQKGIVNQPWMTASRRERAQEEDSGVNPVGPGDKPVNTGRVACHLGHLAILERFLQTSNKYALIFEDDLYIPEEDFSVVRNKIQDVLRNIPSDAQIVYLSYCHELCSLSEPYNRLFLHAVRPLCRHMYLVRRDAAETIRRLTLPMFNTGDKMIGLLITYNVLKGYVVDNNYLNVLQNRQPGGVFRSALGNHGMLRSCSGHDWRSAQRVLHGQEKKIV